MKKMLLILRWPCLLQDVLNRRLLFKPAASSTKGNHHHIISSFLKLGRRKLSMQPKFVAQKMLKQETQQTFVNGLLGFITLGLLYSTGSACVLLTIIA